MSNKYEYRQPQNTKNEQENEELKMDEDNES